MGLMRKKLIINELMIVIPIRVDTNFLFRSFSIFFHLLPFHIKLLYDMLTHVRYAFWQKLYLKLFCQKTTLPKSHTGEHLEKSQKKNIVIGQDTTQRPMD